MAYKLALLLLFFAFPAALYADVSIDCGASGSYTDENLIIWMGDDTVMDNGQSIAIQSNSISHVMATLRVFTTRKKNCYSITTTKGAQVLVRASFFYGNYDKKSAPPSFELHFDGNYWDTIKTSLDQLVYNEVIYVPKSDVMSVCLAQIHPDQFPFISALEVRNLASDMYSHVSSNFALFTVGRVAYGAKSSIRFSDDSYDRIWVPAIVGTGFTTVASDAIFINPTAEDNPPEAVLQNAVTPSNPSANIMISPPFPAKPFPVYVTFYFSEVTQLDTTQTRSFRIYIDNTPSSDPIIPPYGSVKEMYVSNITATANTSFSLVATSDSTLPPIINAMEAFVISDPLTDGTYSKDVDGLAALQDALGLQDWSGDPCLPSPYSWDWINCTADATPRVTALRLGSFGLSGQLPDFSSMDALETIDLHNNSIDGPIPDFLGSLPNLKKLNLADNSFSGPIPTSLSKNNKLKLVVSGNPDLCAPGKPCSTTTVPSSAGSGSTSGTSSSGGGKKSSKLPVILGITIPAFVVFWAIVGFLAVCHQKRKTAAITAAAHGGVANTPPNGTPQAGNGSTINTVAGKFGQALVNEIKVSVHDAVVSEITSQANPQTQQNNN
ncbi:hypothetical protein Tsubulata_016525 [Turnera subulata]|uniref:Malectin-like domain-containing protein n=1 Tax=Turnera subulata TaxID=218843 RepID=A0A9Q0FNJ7_9ROSI|nr:hypothetical protein Tsubulata_016525 [Turnera subulata]